MLTIGYFSPIIQGFYYLRNIKIHLDHVAPSQMGYAWDSLFPCIAHAWIL